MLTAIRDFVRDSFEAKEDDTLETLQVGGLNVWIQESPDMVMAAVIRGEAPQRLRTSLRDTIESIHLELSSELASWNGDTPPFERARPYLEDCLVEVLADSKKGRVSLIPFILIAAIVLGALGTWVGLNVKESRRWEKCQQTLNAEPGILVTSIDKRAGKHFISGLRDPLSKDPMAILKQLGISADEVEIEWRHYQALSPQFILRRARGLLRPPGKVSLSLESGTLYASGSAPHRWIMRARNTARMIAGVDDYQDGNLKDLDLMKLKTAKRRVESTVILFLIGTTDYVPEQSGTYDALYHNLAELYEMARLFERKVFIRIIGRTDKSGPESLNAELSQQRADRVLSELVHRGFGTAGELQAIGVGFSRPLREETTEADRQFNRSVSFEVILKD